ncbi:MAG: tagatose-bisphosphate aldolase, partial [Anaerolineales bacterium]
MADSEGILAMCAMDHRGSMQRMISRTAPDQVTYDLLVEYKRDLTELLAPESTAMLLDPVYGAAQAISSGVLPGNVGLLVSLEETGYESDTQGRVTTLLPEWSV